MEPPKPRFFMAHEKGSFWAWSKKESTQGVLIEDASKVDWNGGFWGEDVGVDGKNDEFHMGNHNWKEKGTRFQAKNKFSQPVDMVCGRSNCIALDRFQQYSRISLHKNFWPPYPRIRRSQNSAESVCYWIIINQECREQPIVIRINFVSAFPATFQQR